MGLVPCQEIQKPPRLMTEVRSIMRSGIGTMPDMIQMGRSLASNRTMHAELRGIERARAGLYRNLAGVEQG